MARCFQYRLCSLSLPASHCRSCVSAEQLNGVELKNDSTDELNDRRGLHRMMMVAVVIVLLLVLVILRVMLVTGFVAVHNDERHYALDGFWVHSGLPAHVLWQDLLYGHANPHLLYNPRTREIRRHGDFSEGFHNPDDNLGTFPRAGHPPLYMITLGGLFTKFDKRWLIKFDHYVLVARALNTILDLFSWLLLFDLLRRFLGVRFSLALVIPIALLPYVLVIGSLAYLDGPGTFMMVLCAWTYFVKTRRDSSGAWWGLLGLLIGAGILMKQSNVFFLPLLAGLTLIWPPARTGRRLIISLLLMTVIAVGTVCSGSNPRKMVAETLNTVELTRHYAENREVLDSGFRRVGYLINPARHYHFGTTTSRPKPFIRSPFLVWAHYFTFPILLLWFGLSVVSLALLRRWRALILPLIISLITIYVPFGSCVRRLYFLLPFVVITMAVALYELRHHRRKAGDRLTGARPGFRVG